MTDIRLEGLFVDLVMACTPDGRPLSRECIAHLRKLARVRTIAGVAVNGPAGEWHAHDRGTRAQLLAIALAGAPDGFPVIAGIPAAATGLAAEAREAVAAGTSGVLLLCGSADELAPALADLAEASLAAPLLAWGPAAAISACDADARAALSAVVAGSPADAATLTSLGIRVLAADGAIDATGALPIGASGALLAAANIGPELWGKAFQMLDGNAGVAPPIIAERFGPLLEALATSAGAPAEDRTAALIKRALFTLTEQSSAATFPPGVELEEAELARIDAALGQGRLLPGSA
jgi:dihydrodipicolinate synthase/N-acetylneuraminate lyase